MSGCGMMRQSIDAILLDWMATSCILFPCLSIVLCPRVSGDEIMFLFLSLDLVGTLVKKCAWFTF